MMWLPLHTINNQYIYWDVAGLIHLDGPVMLLVCFTGMDLSCDWFDSLGWACCVPGLNHWEGLVWLVRFTGMGMLCGWFASLGWGSYVAGLHYWDGPVMWLVCFTGMYHALGWTWYMYVWLLLISIHYPPKHVDILIVL